MQPENKHTDPVNSDNSLNGNMSMSCDTDFSSQLFPKRANQTTNPILKPNPEFSPALTSVIKNEPTIIPSSQIHTAEPVKKKGKIGKVLMIIGIVILVAILGIVFMIIIG